jgi:hypothetical protein
LVAGLHLLRGTHLGLRLVVLVRMGMLVLVLVLVSVLGVCQVLLHFLELLLDGLRHGAPRRPGTAICENASVSALQGPAITKGFPSVLIQLLSGRISKEAFIFKNLSLVK